MHFHVAQTAKHYIQVKQTYGTVRGTNWQQHFYVTKMNKHNELIVIIS